MRKTIAMMVAAAGIFSGAAARAEIFVQVEGIKGTSVNNRHPHWIEATKFSLEVGSAAEARALAGDGEGKLVFKPLVITKAMDTASPALMNAVMTREVIKTAKLELVRPDQREVNGTYYTVKFSELVITNVRQYTDEKTGANMEDVTLSFGRIEIEGAPGPKGEKPPVAQQPAQPVPPVQQPDQTIKIPGLKPFVLPR